MTRNLLTGLLLASTILGSAGLAAVAMGFVLDNKLLITAGAFAKRRSTRSSTSCNQSAWWRSTQKSSERAKPRCCS